MTDIHDTLRKYFPAITDRQLEQFDVLMRLYPQWNAKINVISRKDIDNLFINHILHSLVIASFLGPLAPGTRFIDLGSGGGFPGIPLAVMYPECSFHLVDRIGKKLRVAADIAAQAGLTNVTVQHGDMGECHQRVEYVVSRAVMPLDGLVKLCARNIERHPAVKNTYSPGLICLKGGDIEPESASVRYPIIEYSVGEFMSEPFFETKKLIYVPIC